MYVIILEVYTFTWQVFTLQDPAMVFQGIRMVNIGEMKNVFGEV